ncbi:hypothetical protein Acr_24g0006530 [Actinidia rufa]|uniref:DHHA2 domain-containing protein n=1 Tax=Actinidia rufa TaxID=165716 RepID=A0A7J0GUK0_9ERIC|nr:hypothetical protein Acr_24g0006530 [Actinidia rufa]
MRARDNPFFDGMRRGDAALVDRTTISGLQEKVTNQSIFRSASDNGGRAFRKIVTDAYEKVAYSPSIDSPADIILEPYGRSLPGRWSKMTKTTSSQSPSNLSDLTIDFEEEKRLVKLSSPTDFEATEECRTLTVLARPVIERSYTINKRRTNLSRIPLPPSAAAFYSASSPQIEIVESCESINRLNSYLKATRDDVNAGVPGKFLHAVMGQDLTDVGSVASTIMYAFYLNETLRSNELCTVPVINMKRADLNSHAELKWLLDSCHIDQSSLIFVDEHANLLLITVYYPQDHCIETQEIDKGFLMERIRECPGDPFGGLEGAVSSQEGGGLGILDLVLFNKALLGKWIWRFALGDDKFWCRVIKGKYGILKGAWRTKDISHPHGFSELFALATHQDALVADCWLHSPLEAYEFHYLGEGLMTGRWKLLRIFLGCCEKRTLLVRRMTSGGGRGKAKAYSLCPLSIILLRGLEIPPSLGKGFGGLCLVQSGNSSRAGIMRAAEEVSV